MDMPGKDGGKIEQRKGVENIDPVNNQEPNVSSHWQANGNNLTNSSMIPVSDSIGELSNRSPATGGMSDSFGLSIWEQNNTNSGLNLGGFCDANAGNGWVSNSAFRGGIGMGMFMPNVPGMLPPPSLPHLPHLPADSAFIERAARFSCFGGGNLGEVMMNSFATAATNDPLAPFSRAGLGMMQMQTPPEVFSGNEMKSHEINAIDVGKSDLHNKSDEAEFSGRGAQEEVKSPAREPSLKGLDSKKRKRSEKDVERDENTNTPQPLSADTTIKQKGDQNPSMPGKPGGSKNSKQGSQGSDPPKEEYIHVRARRGQATNSHSLAERVRREKISERMKFLQDLVPGCSKVTGKAVMLDEIINYVQSLQRQVEFLSMKLATVNPRLEFNIESFLAKDSRAGLSPSLPFPPDMTLPFSQLHPSQPSGLIQMGLPGSSSETLRRPVNLQLTSVYKEPTSQIPSSVWEDELHNVVHMGFNPNASINGQDLSGSLQSGHMKTEP